MEFFFVKIWNKSHVVVINYTFYGYSTKKYNIHIPITMKVLITVFMETDTKHINYYNLNVVSNI